MNRKMLIVDTRCVLLRLFCRRLVVKLFHGIPCFVCLGFDIIVRFLAFATPPSRIFYFAVEQTDQQRVVRNFGVHCLEKFLLDRAGFDVNHSNFVGILTFTVGACYALDVLLDAHEWAEEHNGVSCR